MQTTPVWEQQTERSIQTPEVVTASDIDRAQKTQQPKRGEENKTAGELLCPSIDEWNDQRILALMDWSPLDQSSLLVAVKTLAVKTQHEQAPTQKHVSVE